jgi:drug/metabolite transporter (DMT)-like permease
MLQKKVAAKTGMENSPPPINASKNSASLQPSPDLPPPPLDALDAPDESHAIAARLTRGYLICLIATVLWSSTAVFIRYLTVSFAMPPLVLAFWRDLFLATALALVFVLLNRQRFSLGWIVDESPTPPAFSVRSNLRFMLWYGLVLASFNSLWTVSVALNGAAVSTVLAYSSAAFTAVLGWRLFGELLGPVKILAVTLSLAGCVLVAGAYDLAAWRLNPVGIAAGSLSGLAFAGYSLMGKAASERGINPWTTLFYTFLCAAGFLFVLNFMAVGSTSLGWLPQGIGSTNLFWLGASATGWLVLVILAIGPTVGGYGLYTVSLTYLPASVANIIATLEPAMTAALAYFFLGELFTAPQWWGSALIILGVIVLRLREREAVQVPEARSTPSASGGPDAGA